MSIKIIFSDIDGTIVDSNKQIMPKTKAALREITAKGVHFALVSGRGKQAVFTVGRQCEIPLHVVATNGSMVIDRDGNTILDRRINMEDTLAALAAINENFPDTSINYYAGDDWFVKSFADQRTQREMKITATEAKETNLAKLAKEGVLPGKIMLIDEPINCETMERELAAKLPRLKVVRSAPVLVEITEGDINKSVGIDALLKYLNISREESLAFGDNYNDIDMLGFVGKGVVMGNAPADIKAKFAEVTATNDEEGIYEYLKKIGLV